ncbi:unnamed protein product [Phytophthora fragariaefolia]|uniref:Unnamed protein product n=1 Tax=Phytophthora fragariaefolia TaxID=1490495 RepID=A0A9W6Y3J2_9STRA|nr:unnamed protein product [Phytophthora fragariaefolia]
MGSPFRCSKVVLFYFRTVDACVARVAADIAPKHIGVLVNNAGDVYGGLGLGGGWKHCFLKVFVYFFRGRDGEVPGRLDAEADPQDAGGEHAGALLDGEGGAAINEKGSGRAAGNALVGHGVDEQRRADRLLREQGSRERLPRSWWVDASACMVRLLCADLVVAVRLELWHDNVKTIRTLLVCPAAVDSGMFAGVLATDDWAAKLSRFLIPMLTETQVVDSIYRSMLRGDELLVSCFSGWRGIALAWAPAISRLLPVPLYDVVVWLGGGLNGMDTFVGKQRTATKEKDM